jgi:hypothetical protein
MGHQSRIRSSRRASGSGGEVIHREKLFKGRASAEEIHAKFGMKQPCHACGALPVIMIKTLMLHNEFIKREPVLAAEIARTNSAGPYVPTFPTTFGPMVLISKVTACKMHQKELERAAAKGPSYVLIEIDRGPGADKPQVQVKSNNLESLHRALAKA